MACPSDNLGSLLNGLNTILLGVMAILRHQTKADMHDNAAKNLQSLIVTVEFLRDDMTLYAHRPPYTSHPTFPFYFLLYLRAAASPNRFETKLWLRTAARSSADSLAALARYRKYISPLHATVSAPRPIKPSALQVFAKVEEIQEMMPLHPSFQRKALTVHMDLYMKDQTLMSLHKISPQDMARGPRRKGSIFCTPGFGIGYGASVSPSPSPR